MVDGDKTKRIDEYRDKRKQELREIQRALDEEKRASLGEQRRAARAQRVRLVLDTVEKSSGAVVRICAAVVTYHEFSSVAFGLLAYAALETIAGINRQQ
jgi:hypothetical protein